MKKTLTFVALIACSTLNAQYFEHTYGVPNSKNIMGSGQFTDYTGKGHIISGQRKVPNASQLLLVRTEQNGYVIPGPYFENSYFLQDPTGTTTYDILDTKVMEYSNLTYGVFGTCVIDPSINQQALFYANFDQNGNALFSQLYFASLNSDEFKINAVRVADSGQEFYACGMAFDGVQHYAFVMKIDIASGGIIWAYNYIVDTSVLSGEPEEAFDLIEYPFLGHLLVVGRRHVCVSTSDDGYIMHLNPGDGSLIACTDFYGTNSTADAFTSIERNNLGDAFYVGGWTGNTVSNRDSWILRFDQNLLNPSWTNTLDYQGQGIDNHGVDVIERIDANSNPMVYLLSQASVGVQGLKDSEVDQLNGLSGVNIGQYTYGNTRPEVPSNIHKWNANSVEDGLAVYSTRELILGRATLLLQKTYFNGYTSCNYNLSTEPEVAGPGYLYCVKSLIVEHYTAQPAHVEPDGNLVDFEVCHDDSVPGGSNAINQSISENTDNATNIKQIEGETILIESVSQQNMEVILYDLQGKIVENFGTINFADNAGMHRINLSDLNINQGVYILTCYDGNVSTSARVLKF